MMTEEKLNEIRSECKKRAERISKSVLKIMKHMKKAEELLNDKPNK